LSEETYRLLITLLLRGLRGLGGHWGLKRPSCCCAVMLPDAKAFHLPELILKRLESISQSVSQSVSQSASQPGQVGVSQSDRQSDRQSVGQSVSQPQLQ